MPKKIAQTDNCFTINTGLEHHDHPVLYIGPEDDGSITFTEACDNYYQLRCTKEEAIEILHKAIKFIENLP